MMFGKATSERVEKDSQFRLELDSEYRFYRYIYEHWKLEFKKIIMSGKSVGSQYLTRSRIKLPMPQYLIQQGINLFEDIDILGVFESA